MCYHSHKGTQFQTLPPNDPISVGHRSKGNGIRPDWLADGVGVVAEMRDAIGQLGGRTGTMLGRALRLKKSRREQDLSSM